MLSRLEVERVAQQACLYFEEEEWVGLQTELSLIIDYVQQISELDLAGLEPTSHAVSLKNVFRSDEPVPSLTGEEAVSSGPAVEQGLFMVPRIG